MGYKPYVCAGSTHTAIDALGSIMKENGLRPDDIAVSTAAPWRTGIAPDLMCLRASPPRRMSLFYALAAMARC
jgi:hypothetical protein